jgi:predicted phage baseplate assembly protein
MSITLPNLDDRRWVDLVTQGTSLIPFYAPDWTDYNLSDPGITIIELLAWLTEQNIYQFNRIPPSHVLKFLKLVGGLPAGAQPATLIIAASVNEGVNSLTIPATTEFSATAPNGTPLTFRSQADVMAIASTLVRTCVDDGSKILDVSTQLAQQGSAPVFGSNPSPGAAIYFGFDSPLPANSPLSIYFNIIGDHARPSERARIIAEDTLLTQRCRRFQSNPCCNKPPSAPVAAGQPILVHPAVTTVWEYFDGKTWASLDSTQVHDQTRAFTLSGSAILTLPSASQPASITFDISAAHFVRCRFSAGAYDAPPHLQSAAFNAIETRQLYSGAATLQLTGNPPVRGTPPAVGSNVQPIFQFGANGIVESVAFGTSGPAFRFLGYSAPTATTPAAITLEAILLGTSTGMPDQAFPLQYPLAAHPPPTILTCESGTWRTWQIAPDLDSAGASDSFVALDVTGKAFTFGDGLRGLIPPAGALIFVQTALTAGVDGNVPADAITALSSSQHNQSLPGFAAFSSALDISNTTNPKPAFGGANAQAVGAAEETAMLSRTATSRAVTLDDFRALTLQTPGFQLARVMVLPGVDPFLPCAAATGIVTLVIIPFLPAGKPTPSRGQLTAVANYLEHRRIPGTVIRVVGPQYINIGIKTVVVAEKGFSATIVQKNAAAAILAFLHPLIGGDDKQGWPLGRRIYSADLLNVIAAAHGVSHVVSVELIDERDCSQSHAVALGTFGLPAASPPQIQVRTS